MNSIGPRDPIGPQQPTERTSKATDLIKTKVESVVRKAVGLLKTAGEFVESAAAKSVGYRTDAQISSKLEKAQKKADGLLAKLESRQGELRQAEAQKIISAKHPFETKIASLRAVEVQARIDVLKANLETAKENIIRLTNDSVNSKKNRTDLSNALKEHNTLSKQLEKAEQQQNSILGQKKSLETKKAAAEARVRTKYEPQKQKIATKIEVASGVKEGLSVDKEQLADRLEQIANTKDVLIRQGIINNYVDQLIKEFDDPKVLDKAEFVQDVIDADQGKLLISEFGRQLVKKIGKAGVDENRDVFVALMKTGDRAIIDVWSVISRY